jgi:hypothetical protein
MTPYELTFEQRSFYLYARVAAVTIDRESASAYLLDVAVKCEELSSDRLLLERDIPAMLSISDLFFTTQSFLGMMGGIRVAILNPYEPIAKELQFAMMIADNRGAQFRLARDLADAEAWLRSD